MPDMPALPLKDDSKKPAVEKEAKNFVPVAVIIGLMIFITFIIWRIKQKLNGKKEQKNDTLEKRS